MALIKCPRCELNYIEEGEGYCKICKREMKGEQTRDDFELCTVCNEQPALPGKDVCLFCLKEMSNEDNDVPDDDAEHPEHVGEATISIDPVSTMDEIIPEIDEDIPAREYSEIENDLSLNVMEEEEDSDEDDDEKKNSDEM